MPLDIIIGTQWGDEGKGRVVDLLSARADLVARYNGGDNPFMSGMGLQVILNGPA